MIETRTLNVDFKRNESTIEQSWNLVGWRIYLTNTLENTLSLIKSTRDSRNERLVERGFRRFKKGKIPALPLYSRMRIPERVKDLILLLIVVLFQHLLIFLI